MEISVEEFDALVNRALDSVPSELAGLVHNVVVQVEENPPAHEPGLLGLYVGLPLTERQANYSAELPDQIFIYRGPLVQMCSTPEELEREVEVTVVHEIAHHFGIDDSRLHALGYA